MPAASLDLKGFQTRYSVLVAMGTPVSPFVGAAAPVVEEGVSMEMRFSP